jgi:hypothetical protein
LIILVALILAVSIFICGFASGLLLGGSSQIISDQPKSYPTPDASISITVAKDGCHVDRTELTGSSPVDSLTWVVSDMDGYVLLERNAEGEYKYGYFQGGMYRIHMKGWYKGRYHQVSNEVIVDCP